MAERTYAATAAFANGNTSGFVGSRGRFRLRAPALVSARLLTYPVWRSEWSHQLRSVLRRRRPRGLHASRGGNIKPTVRYLRPQGSAVASTLTALSLTHLAHGISIVTAAPRWENWAMAIGIDLGFVALEREAVQFDLGEATARGQQNTPSPLSSARCGSAVTSLCV
jgi:hypothetical protein